MRILLRIVSFAAMLIALIQFASAVSGFFDDDKTQTTSSALKSTEGAITSDAKKSPLVSREKIDKICRALDGPFYLFCYAAVLYILIRISTTQENDAPLPPGASAVERKDRL